MTLRECEVTAHVTNEMQACCYDNGYKFYADNRLIDNFTLPRILAIVFVPLSVCYCLLSSTDFFELKFNQFKKKVMNSKIRVGVATYQEIIDSLKDVERFLIDVRDTADVNETGHIPTSINIPCERLSESVIFIINFDILQWKKFTMNCVCRRPLLQQNMSVQNQTFMTKLFFIASLEINRKLQARRLLKLASGSESSMSIKFKFIFQFFSSFLCIA